MRKITIVGAAGGEVIGSAYYSPGKPRVILTHGEGGPREGLAKKVKQDLELASRLPMMGDMTEL